MLAKRQRERCGFKSGPPHMTEQGWKNAFLVIVAIGIGLAIWLLRAMFGVQIPGID